LTIIRLGKTREATGFTSEKYKAAIRQYMEAMGYAQLTDSSKEGHLPDMVFRPLGKAPWPEIWVESKATELSLGASHLVEEVRSYLKEWLLRIPPSRFKFMLFAKKLVNLSRWDLIWGNNLSQSDALEWLTRDLDEPQVNFTDPTRLKEVVSFLSETSVVEGTDVDLTDMAEEKRKVALSANEIRQKALRQLALMDQRSRPIPKKSDLIANLLRFTPPSSYLVLGIDQLSMIEIQNLMRRRDSPPYCVLERGRLLTLDYENVESSFSVLNPSRLQTLTLHELETTYPRPLAQLVNYGIGKVLRRLGVGFSSGRSYFLADRQAKEGKKRVLDLPSGETMQVARPYSSPMKENTLEGEYPKRVNFVFHLAFRLRYRSLWGQHFIEFGLGKIYTEEGVTVIVGNRAARLDGRFRNPAFDRSETRQRKMEKLARYVFHSNGRSYSHWLGMFNFGEFLKLKTNWTPETVPLSQAIMDDFNFAQEDGEDE
jgi:hypothetical protein